MNNIEITSNTTGNHLNALKKMISETQDRLIIASPFLATDMTALLAGFRFSGIKRIDLITTLRPRDPEQITKPRVLRQFIEFFRQHFPNVDQRLHIDNELHGKVYIPKGSGHTCMIISSANFTRSGLTENHEWGLRVADSELIDTVIEEIFDTVEYDDITYHQIKKACLFSDHYEKEHPEWVKRPEIFSDILDQIYKVEDASNANPKYFLKPIGTSEDPIKIEEGWDFSALHQNLYFSKKRPKGVRKGDIVITTAIGPGSLLSWFKVTGALAHVTNEDLSLAPWLERWPWYMEGRNQSQKFGQEWWKHNIRRQDALSEFLEKFPGSPVTKAGGFTLNTINRGNDKVQITKEFGEFLIGKIRSAFNE